MAARASSKTDRVIAERLMVSPLFENMTVDEVHNCFTCSGALCLSFKKGDMIFTEEDEPTKLHILLEGGVRIGYDPSTATGESSETSQIRERCSEIYCYFSAKRSTEYSLRLLATPRLLRYHASSCLGHARADVAITII